MKNKTKMISEKLEYLFNMFVLLNKKGLIKKEEDISNDVELTLTDFINKNKNELVLEGGFSIDAAEELSEMLESKIISSFPEQDFDYVNSLPESDKKVRVRLSNASLRFKYVIKKVNTTNNPKWGHYEKYWKLQCANDMVNGEKIWLDVDDVFFIEDEHGNQREISAEQYRKFMDEKV